MDSASTATPEAPAAGRLAWTLVAQVEEPPFIPSQLFCYFRNLDDVSWILTMSKYDSLIYLKFSDVG